MMILLGPAVPERRASSPAVVLHGLEGLVEAAYSKLPEHSAAKAEVVSLNLRTRELAAQLAQALPEELQEFWEAYSGWFAMYSVGPLLANERMVQEALPTPEQVVRVVENWRSAGWWSGRELLEPAVAELLGAAGLRVEARPGATLRALRRALLPSLSRHYGRRNLNAEARQAVQARQAMPRGTAEPCEALWLSVGASSVELIGSLAPALRDEGVSSGILDYDYFGSREALQRSHLPHLDSSWFKSPQFIATAAALAHRLAREWPQIAAAARRLPLAEQLHPGQVGAILDRLRVVLLRDAAAWVVQSQAAHAALEAYQPRVVVGFHVYGPVIAPMVVAARRRGVPRVCLQHGVIGPRYLALPCLPYDEKLVFGPYAAEIMEQVKAPGMRVTVTGHTLYDSAQEPVRPRPEVLALRDGVSGLVVLCTQFNEHLFHQPEGWWLAEVANACRKLGARLALKLHPSDGAHTLPLYRQVLRPGDDRVVLIPHGQYPLSELLAACDVMVTRDSTVVFEANLLDKPVVTINLSRWEEELPYAQTGGALGVYQHEAIGPAIQAALQDETVRGDLALRRQQFLKAHTGQRDGGATRRISSAIASHARLAGHER